MKFGVVVFPGSNCDEDMVHVLEHGMGQRVERLWHKEHDLKGCDMIVLPGGFSYGDYLRSGAIARFSPIMREVSAFAQKGGLVLGVCNGFQILTEAGMLPGALTRNAHLRFECRDVFVTPVAEGPFTSGLPRVLRLPIAHAEGRYQAAPEVLAALERDGQVALRYCDASGNVGETSNPNGSLSGIAGIYGGPRKNVLGLMPHPERMSETLVGGADGRTIFDAVVRAASSAGGR